MNLHFLQQGAEFPGEVTSDVAASLGAATARWVVPPNPVAAQNTR
jgi:hypothetical protein